MRFAAYFNLVIILPLAFSVSCRKMGLNTESAKSSTGKMSASGTKVRDVLPIGSGTLTTEIPKFESADIIKLNTGLLLAILSNECTHGDKTSLFKCTSSDNGLTWTAPQKISMPNPDKHLMLNVNVFYVASRLYLVIQRTPDGVKELGPPRISHSDDNGNTWSAPQRMLAGKEKAFVIINSRNITTTNTGRIIVPVAYGQSVNRVGVLYSDDNGISWMEGPHPFGIKGSRFGEPSIGRLSDGRLLMLIRTASGWIYKSYSHDNGIKWSTPIATTLQSPWTAHAIRITPEGYVVVVFTNSPVIGLDPGFPRNNLTFAVSMDNGESWGNYTQIIGATDPDYIVMEPSITFVSDKIQNSYLHQ